MAEISKKKTEPVPFDEEEGEEYELLSHREIVDLRDELRKLKLHPTERTLQLTMAELAGKVDKLIDIFGEALHEIRIEEGGLTFQDKMKPLVDRMDKILEQNSQIAEGVVAIADLVSELKDMMGGAPAPARALPSIGAGMPPPPGPAALQPGVPPPGAPGEPAKPPGLPPMPLPPK